VFPHSIASSAPSARARSTQLHFCGVPDLLREVTDPKGYLNPVGPTAAACLGCHTSIDAASHALANTTKLGENCSSCHGPSGDFSVDRLHAR
jgi:hypothetical protein